MERTKPYTVTAEALYANHRAILGGDNAKSAATGHPLNMAPLLKDAPPGVQGTHWGLAAYVALLHGTDLPPVPPGVTQEQAENILCALEIKQAG